VSTAVVKAKPGRPRSPRDVAERTELVRVASLAHQVLVSMRRQGRGMYDSELDLRSWLAEDGTAFTSGDLSPALALLEACGKIGRSAAKSNSPRAGWLLSVNGKEPVNGSVSVSEPVPVPAVSVPESAITPVVSEPVEAALELPEAAHEPVSQGTDEERVNGLAQAIVKSFYVSGRGFQGNRFLCESEAVLRQYLTEDGVRFDDDLLAAAFRVLEAATLAGSDARLIRGSQLGW
jgi:hypothetical protein